MGFRKLTKEELDNILNGSAWLKALLRKMLVVDEVDCTKIAICSATTDVTEIETIPCEPWSHDFIADNENIKLTKQDIITQAINGGLTLLNGDAISDISEIVIAVEHIGGIGYGGFIATTSHIDLIYNGGYSTLTGGESKSFGSNSISIANDLCLEIYQGSILSLSAVFI